MIINTKPTDYLFTFWKENSDLPADFLTSGIEPLDDLKCINVVFGDNFTMFSEMSQDQLNYRQWLFVLTSLEDLDAVKKIPFQFQSNAYIVFRDVDRHDFELLEVYQAGNTARVFSLGYLKSFSAGFQSKYDRRNNLFGVKLRYSVLPYIFQVIEVDYESKKHRGLFNSIMNILTKSLNFTLEFVASPTNSWGSAFPYDTGIRDR